MTDISEYDDLNLTDELDRATGYAMRDNANAVAAVRAASAPESIPDGEGGHIFQIADENGDYPIPECVVCDEPIIPLRLEMGRIRCVPCQELREQKR